MPGHTCPYGIKTLDLLDRQGFDVDDVHLETEEETTAFREKWNVETTPQTFVNGELVGTLDVYPYAETGAGILMIAAVLNWVSVTVALFIGSFGAASVVKAVYIDKRELKCACVGGSSNVPLGFVSFTENAAMVAMAIWMGAKYLI